MKIICSLFGHKSKNSVYDLEIARSIEYSKRRIDLENRKLEAFKKDEIFYGVVQFMTKEEEAELYDKTFSKCDRCGVDVLSINLIKC